jgi:hypothetical protein
MLAERPKVEQAVSAVCGRQDFALQRIPEDHAGGKWRLRYDSALGQGGNVEVDLNFMFRIPLWPIVIRDSRPIGSRAASGIPILNEHELAAGKLAALLSRHAARDLFDAHQFLTRAAFDPGSLRLAFIVYGAMNRKDWRTVSVDDIGFETHELRSTLFPVLRTDHLTAMDDPKGWAQQMVEETRAALSVVLPFTHAEREFLDRILHHPALLWKAQNVREFKGI